MVGKLLPGWSVKYIHFRPRKKTVREYGLKEAIRRSVRLPDGPLKVALFPKGGRTECHVKDPEGRVMIVGVAHCSHLDDFDYEDGRKAALDRAFKGPYARFPEL